MKTAAFIRLHAFDENPAIVFDAIAEHADALFFLTNNVQNPSLIEAATSHPAYAGIRDYGGRWSNHGTLLKCYEWADEIQPEFVMTFDEDEMPPPALKRLWGDFEKSGALSMIFNCVWCYGDVNTILKKKPCPFGWHVKIHRWLEGSWKNGMANMHYLKDCMKTKPFQCVYPFRHLPVMTPHLRSIRDGRRDRHHFWTDSTGSPTNVPLETIPYDPEMAYPQWISQGKI